MFKPNNIPGSGFRLFSQASDYPQYHKKAKEEKHRLSHLNERTFKGVIPCFTLNPSPLFYIFFKIKDGGGCFCYVSVAYIRLCYVKLW